MSHHKHHTEGFILESRNFGEANRYFTIFTRELGVVRAAAQGVRLLKSKLRYGLQDYAYAKVDLVRGREIWRVTSSAPLFHFPKIKEDKYLFLIYIRMLRLIERLSPGEEPNEKLFEDLLVALAFLEGAELAKENIADAEAVIVLKILSRLGYVGESEVNTSIIESPISLELLLKVSPQRTAIISQINQSLHESQL
jgi:DNA repair protein RecO (recombination protein O)